MATDDNGGLNKRSQSSSSNDPNNSFIKKVTSRVSGFIPSSFSRWFGPGEVTPSVVRSREPDDEDDPDTSIVQQPPKKRVKIPSEVEGTPANSNYRLTSTPLVNPQTDLWLSQPGPSGLNTNTSCVRPDFTSQETVVQVQTNGDDKSDSGDSTSGYSSAPLQRNKESSTSSERVNDPEPKASTSLFNESYTSHSRSLFEHSPSTQKPCLSSRRPSFNASIFGSPSFIDRTLTTKRAINSPFYGGKTMYGGASSCKRPRIFTREDVGSRLKNTVEMKPVNEPTNENAGLSNVARRILNTLEQFSTPILDARKIPNVNRPAKESAKSQKIEQTPYTRRPVSKELLVPTIPELLKMKQREKLQNSTVSVRNVAVNSKSVLNNSYCPALNEEPVKQQKHTNKIRSKMASAREHKNPIDEEVVDAPVLPDVKLPITTLPKFDFFLPPPVTPLPKPVQMPSPIAKLPMPAEPAIQFKAPVSQPSAAASTATAKFSFASPIIMSTASTSVPSLIRFAFSQPMNAKSSTTESAVTPIAFKSTSSNTAPRRKEASKNNGQNTEMMFGLQPAAKLETGSVMDILGKTKTTESSSLMDKFKPAAGTWECSACMVRNNSISVNCVACETPKDGSKKPSQQPISGFGNQFKMASDKWECSSCMVRNNASDSKCVACTTSKPGAPAPKAAPIISTSTPGFGDKFKPDSGTWECGVCMIRNKNTDSKCVACESAKPGSQVSGKSTLIMPPENKSTSGFLNFMKKDEGKWECGSCMVRNDQDKTECVCCNTPKPGCASSSKNTSEEKPIFKFGIDPGAKSNNAPTFTFGVNKSSESVTPSTFTFGVPAKPKENISTTTAATTAQTFSFGTSSSSVATPSTNISTPSTPFTFSSVPKTVEPICKPETSTPIVAKSNMVPAGIFGNVSSSTANDVSSSVTTIVTSKPVFTFGKSTGDSVAKCSTVSSSAGIFSNTFAPSSTSASALFETKATANVTTEKSSTFSASTTTSNPFMDNRPELFGTPSTGTVTATSTVTSTTFSFSGPTNVPTDKLPTFDSSFPLPQFNFGPSSLPFTVNKSDVTSAAPTPTLPPSTVNAFVAPKVTPEVNSMMKSEVKPFTFGSTTVESKPSTFSFAPKENITKPAMFNFGSTSKIETQMPSSDLFSFGATKGTTSTFSTSKSDVPMFGAPKTDTTGFAFPKPDPPTFGVPNPNPVGFGGAPSIPPMFGGATQTPKNGGFNFGAPAATPNFNFGVGGNVTPAPAAVFGFGSGQISSSSSGGFSMGSSAPTPPTFNPDVKATFNFTGGSTPNFSASPSSSSMQPMPVRKIRKAVRRTQPR